MVPYKLFVSNGNHERTILYWPQVIVMIFKYTGPFVLAGAAKLSGAGEDVVPM